ncbi:unnamed protein product [Tuber melanosporum]|uniref:(Perigord truffle) hypothetical protein n=1 Tax=Tuber melanosporum (strain Mel28) TaxID=656061 RepID=D5GBA4_TUBMM|nr:uncharacterized protein GSTUM_00000538001 [Tuber melanosporum]CAZ81797.1 unnamed protein product [Tuber melanosporum]
MVLMILRVPVFSVNPQTTPPGERDTVSPILGGLSKKKGKKKSQSLRARTESDSLGCWNRAGLGGTPDAFEHSFSDEYSLRFALALPGYYATAIGILLGGAQDRTNTLPGGVRGSYCTVQVRSWSATHTIHELPKILTSIQGKKERALVSLRLHLLLGPSSSCRGTLKLGFSGVCAPPPILSHSSCRGLKKPSCYGGPILDTCSILWNVMLVGNTRVQYSAVLRNLWHKRLTISRYSAGTVLRMRDCLKILREAQYRTVLYRGSFFF